MNDKLLQKLLKLIAKTQAVGSEQTRYPEEYIENNLLPAPPDEPLGRCCYLISNPVIRLGNSRRGEEPSFLHYNYYCKTMNLSRAQCYQLKGVFYSRTIPEGYEGAFVEHLPLINEQSGNSCCITPPISDTPGGQFVPIEA